MDNLLAAQPDHTSPQSPQGGRVAVLQSNYIPWKGYFDLIHDVDLFIFYDDVQFTKNDWRNRNRIKTAAGTSWLTIPVGGQTDRLICEVEIHEHGWQRKHWKSLQQHYAAAPFFNQYRGFFEQVYLDRTWTSLSELNQFLIRTIAREHLGIVTQFDDSRRYSLQGQKQARLLDLLQQVGATSYLSGPAAAAYIDPAEFEQSGIELFYKSYAGYPEYPQFHPPFEHSVSVLDLLFQTGSEARNFLWERPAA